MSDLRPVEEASAKTFTDLPPEIIEQIGWDVDPRGLRNLRLVSRYVGASSERPMLKENFSQLRILLASPSSLRRALRVVRSVKLRKYMQVVCIFIDQFHRSVLSTPSLLHLSSSTETSVDTELKRQQRRSHLPLYKGWLQDQEWLKATGNDERELREVFYHLRLQPGVHIYVTDLQLLVDSENFPGEAPREYMRMMEEHGEKPAMWAAEDDHRASGIVFKTIQESSIQPSAFTCRCSNYGLPLRTFTPGKMTENLCKLSHLELVLQPAPDNSHTPSNDITIGHFITFLEERTNDLKYLHLTVLTDPEASYEADDLDQVLGIMTRKLFFPKIETMYFSNVRTDYKSITSYLSAHKETIKDWELHSIIVKDCDATIPEDALDERIYDELVAAGLTTYGCCWGMVNGGA